MINIKNISFTNSTESSIIISSGNKYYLEVMYYNDDKKSLWVYDMETDISTKILTVNLEYNFFCDSYNKKIYCYNIDGNMVKISKIEGNKLIDIVEKNISYTVNDIQIFAVNNHFFIKIQKDDEEQNNPMECYMFSLETMQFYNVEDFAFTNSVYIPQYIIDNNKLSIVLEESYVSSNEIPEVRKAFGHTQFTNNKILVYNFNQFITEIKNNMPVTKKVLLQSKGNEYISLLGIKDDKIIVFKSNEKHEIIYININGTTIEKIIDNRASFMLDNDDIFFICYDNDKNIVLNNNNQVLYCTDINYDEEKVIIGIIENRYIIFDVNKYDEDNKYKQRLVYDCINNEEKTYNCNFIRINKIII